MPVARFFFFQDLNTFLPPGRRGGSFDYAFENGQSVKHLFEAAGVPHTEVGEVRINGQGAGFEYKVKDGDQVEIVPASAENDPYPGEPRFVLDNHLGRLAAYLRMVGLDSLYKNDYDDEELAHIAKAENRILLTRDRRLLMRRAVRYGYCLRSLDSKVQMVEVMQRFDLFEHISPFQRCLRCNARLEPVSKEMVLDRLEPLTRLYYEEFHHCPACGQVYWKGSHYERMQRRIEQFRQERE